MHSATIIITFPTLTFRPFTAVLVDSIDTICITVHRYGDLAFIFFACLGLPEVTIYPFYAQEIVMSTLLNNGSVIYNHDKISVPDG
jgi:hypothetical protein